MYYQYPIESLARRRRADSQLEFARQARLVVPDSDELLSRPVAAGLALYAANEEALREPARILRELYGDFVEVRPPRVRVIPGEPAQEPVMNVRVAARLEHAGRIADELHRRGARVLEQCIRGRTFVIRAEAPLACVLGLPATLDGLTAGSADHSIRLVRYADVREDPGGGAA